MEIIKAEGLIKDYGRTRALDGINLSINQGEVYGFIGPNGAGKSTTIRILLGIIKATEGTSLIFGKDSWRDAVEIHKRLAYVPGELSLWPNLTGGETIDLFMKMRGHYDKKRRDELIKNFDLDPSKKCRTYSKGNRQKVGLIAAFASQVDLYLLDEPTSGLDPLMEKIFQEYVEEIRGRGAAILLSSHILSEVEKLCDRVSIIRQGIIIDSGMLSDLRHLMRSKIKVTTEEDVTPKGVHNLKRDGNTLTFDADNDKIGAVISELSKHGITALDTAPPTLEELFMSHYESVDINA